MLKYIGIDYRTLDCYDLVRYYHAQEFNNTLPSLSYKRIAGVDLLNRNDLYDLKNVANDAMPCGFSKVTKPILGDIILLRILNMPLHVGIYLNERQFLHTQRETGSCVEKLDKWEKRILGYYRYDKI